MALAWQSQELYGIRDYLNEGGKVLYTGQRASQQYAANAVGNQFYNPFDNSAVRGRQCVRPACRPLAGSGDNLNDVIEYWFDASLVNVGAGLDPETGDPLDVEGIDNPLDGLTWEFNGADSAENQGIDALRSSRPAASCRKTSIRRSPAGRRPTTSARAGPFEPHSGEQYVYSEVADVYLQAHHSHDQRAGGRCDHVVLDLVRHRSRLGHAVRRGSHTRRG